MWNSCKKQRTVSSSHAAPTVLPSRHTVPKENISLFTLELGPESPINLDDWSLHAKMQWEGRMIFSLKEPLKERYILVVYEANNSVIIPLTQPCHIIHYFSAQCILYGSNRSDSDEIVLLNIKEKREVAHIHCDINLERVAILNDASGGAFIIGKVKSILRASDPLFKAYHYDGYKNFKPIAIACGLNFDPGFLCQSIAHSQQMCFYRAAFGANTASIIFELEMTENSYTLKEHLRLPCYTDFINPSEGFPPSSDIDVIPYKAGYILKSSHHGIVVINNDGQALGKWKAWNFSPEEKAPCEVIIRNIVVLSDDETIIVGCREYPTGQPPHRDDRSYDQLVILKINPLSPRITSHIDAALSEQTYRLPYPIYDAFVVDEEKCDLIFGGDYVQYYKITQFEPLVEARKAAIEKIKATKDCLKPLFPDVLIDLTLEYHSPRLR
jgi:hypothetical protein